MGTGLECHEGRALSSEGSPVRGPPCDARSAVLVIHGGASAVPPLQGLYPRQGPNCGKGPYQEGKA